MALELMSTDQCKLIIRSDKTPVGAHERRFNSPIVNEDAIVMVADGSDRRDIIIQKRGGSLERIAETHRSYDSTVSHYFLAGRGREPFLFKTTKPRYGINYK
ncbi:hypothetical protein AVEN_155543-1 [Araneus ventricosus]|uniref:Uncharacterized protein n=1 Tax=Araneus ventricosus TaxID=182803 RepID=A0A4Y1ZMD7_ARAVE|nr:hypothetical protein AVEN_132291-1 [Araneus ventricosus]GBL57378.1 hypothetical protein AVEN_155543-1 [Araneus ventricosus]